MVSPPPRLTNQGAKAWRVACLRAHRPGPGQVDPSPFLPTLLYSTRLLVVLGTACTPAFIFPLGLLGLTRWVLATNVWA